MTKVGRFLRRFLIVKFSAVDFLDFVKTVNSQHHKLILLFLYTYDIFKAMNFYGLISNSWSYSSRKKGVVTMLSCYTRSIYLIDC